jgi:lysophospholipase L1-like esterase
VFAVSWRLLASLAGVTALPAVALAAAQAPAAPATAAAQRPAANPCAPGPITATLAPNTNRLGVVDLHFLSNAGTPVAFFECVAGRALALGERFAPAGQATTLWSATFWRCGRLTRQFAATTKLADGTLLRGASGVRTVSCARRFKLELPARGARGKQARVRIVDTWGTGEVRVQLCITAPRGTSRCSSVPLRRTTTAVRHFRPTSRGRWKVELRVASTRVSGVVPVGVPGGAKRAAPPTVLATGDSTMQGIESFVADELGDAATVVSDVRPGFAISKENGWQPVAASQAVRLKPRATVVSIGANEGFTMTTPDGTDHPCCGADWVAEYARRVRTSMITYLRNGRGRVYWLTIVAPKEARRVPFFNATNQGIVQAAQGLAGVRVLRLDELFTPDGFRETMPYRGRTVRVREKDGIHLNVLGTQIAARVVARAVRADGPPFGPRATSP